MKFKVVLAFLVLATLAALPIVAADLDGKWKSTMETPRGTQEQTFDFKVDGNKLTGKVITQRGEVEIKDGKVNGDDIEFTVERTGQGGQTMSIPYKGKVSGDTIKGTTGTGDRQREWTANRVKSI